MTAVIKKNNTQILTNSQNYFCKPNSHSKIFHSKFKPIFIALQQNKHSNLFNKFQTILLSKFCIKKFT